MGVVKSLCCRILDLAVIPDEIKNLRGKLILHVSDTPSSFYNTMDRIIKILDPPWIIHTGDLVDQVKVGLHKRDKELYAQKLRKLRSILEYGNHNEERKIIITLGNHDVKDIVERLFNRSAIYDRVGHVEIEGLKFNLSHYHSLLSGEAGTFNLYGHNSHQPLQDPETGVFLNGLLGMNLIKIPEGDVYNLCYPRYVNDHRTTRHKVGL